MPGTGALEEGEKWVIEIELEGALDPVKASEFDADLRAFITAHKNAAYKVKWTKTDPAPPQT